MILRCSFEGHERKCSDLFYPQVGKKISNGGANKNIQEEVAFQITDEGLCCSFNTMPEPVMFRNEVVKVPENKTLTKRWSYWDLENGFLNDISLAMAEDSQASATHRHGSDSKNMFCKWSLAFFAISKNLRSNFK